MPKKQKEKEINQIDELKTKCAELESGWRRALADYENLKKDQLASAAKARDQIKIGFAEDLLPVIDNFAQAVKFAPAEDALPDDMKPWFQGVMFIQKQFEAVMNGLGISPIATDGSFDANVHEAAGTRSESGREDGKILEVVLPGWKIGDHVLRPAKVIINQITETE